MSLSHVRLRELLDYDPATGIFTWRVNGRGRFMRKGATAGTLTTLGYRQITIDQDFFGAGALAVFWMTGKWPPNVVDHINCEPDDNRWSNLRLATHSQNHANGPGGRKKKYVSLKGVTWQKRNQRYMAQIRVNYQTIYLGYFDTAQEAHAAYVTAARKYFGEFARAR